ncbi:MAG: glutamine--fructose-6-phosphate transaminase (isomerizing), partial [Proteobacteria bacterium]|nr:glutamine--fructose-6-phosphate transaminase (isomerizing) [Pseudomonadota bacterium]
MCGIIGIIGKGEVAPLLIEGLRRLEYRGYDSAGVATLVDGRIERRRAEGKLTNLETLLAREPVAGTIGIGHTRWATHGVPNEKNAHPHATDRVAVVHNGIIENFQALRAEVEERGHTLVSDTDTEVVAHLITLYLEDGKGTAEATCAALNRLEGAFALGIIFAGKPDLMIAARRGSPLAIGYGDGEMYLGSDALALAPLTREIMYLEDGDWAVITADDATVFDAEHLGVKREVRLTAHSGATLGKGGYRHFMLKEIFEQPQVIGDTLHAYTNPTTRSVALPDLGFDAAETSAMTLVACGTSYYACMVARCWLERLARIPVDVDVASEFRYRGAYMAAGGVALFVSQSGETADTLAALRYARDHGQHIVSVVNVPESTIARESDAVLQTYAGPEVGVASTKAFTTQLTVLACFAIATARARGVMDHDTETRLVDALAGIPARAAEVLNDDDTLRALAHQVAEARDVLYLGRGTSYPIALEGA